MTTWSKELPTEEGWYWWREDAYKAPELWFAIHTRVLAGGNAKPSYGEWLRIPSPDEVAALEKDAKRFRYCVEYNWIAASIRVKHRIQDGDIDSARAAIDSAMKDKT